jgi:hypothetical protein
VVAYYESEACEQLANSTRRIGLHEEYLPDLYFKSVRWVSEVLAAASVLA